MLCRLGPFRVGNVCIAGPEWVPRGATWHAPVTNQIFVAMRVGNQVGNKVRVHRMRFLTSKLGLVLFVAVASAAAFAFFYHQLTGSEYISDPRLKAIAQVSELDVCLKTEGNKATACVERARKLLQGISTAGFSYNKSSNFNVHIDQDALVFVKPKCQADDVSVNTFVWAVYPKDKSVLPESRRTSGYFTGTEDFKTKGFMVQDTCLISARLPIADYQKFEAGQYMQGEGKWLWYVN